MASQEKLQMIKLLEETERIEEAREFNTTTIKNINRLLTDIEETYQKNNINYYVEHVDQFVIDAKLLHSAVSLCKEAGKAVNIISNVYIADEFIECLQNQFNNDFDRFGEQIEPMLTIVPSYNYLYGSIVPKEVPQEPKKRRRALENTIGEQAKPDELKITEEVEDDLLRIIRKMFHILKNAVVENKNRPVPYHEFVINNEDFSATVENMFHFAFLVRDGLVKLTLESDVVFIQSVKKSQREAEKSTLENVQNIISLSYDDWEELVDVFKNREGIYQRHARLAEQNKRKKSQ